MSIRKTIITTLAAASLLGLSACATSNNESASNTPKDEKVQVVASTNVWGSVAQAVGGNLVEVKSVISSPDQDPHDYEATAQDKLAFSKAKIAVINGGGYDDWAVKLAESVNPKPTVLDAVKISGLQKDGEKEFNEHVFYSINTAKKVASDLAQNLSSISPNNKGVFEKNLSAFNMKMDELLAKAKHVAQEHPGMMAIATEPVTGYLMEDMGIKNVTPEEFVEQSESDAGPSAAIVNETVKLLTDKKAQILALNGQTEDAVSNKLKEAANKAGIPIVLVYETFPKGINSYYDFINNTIEAFHTAMHK